MEPLFPTTRESGVEACAAANKIPGVFAVLITEHYTPYKVEEDEDLYVRCLGGQVTGYALSDKKVMNFLNAGYSAGIPSNHRLAKVQGVEKRKQNTNSGKVLCLIFKGIISVRGPECVNDVTLIQNCVTIFNLKVAILHCEKIIHNCPVSCGNLINTYYESTKNEQAIKSILLAVFAVMMIIHSHRAQKKSLSLIQRLFRELMVMLR
jgi:hypothetical protein